MGIFKTADHVCNHRHSFALDNFFRRIIQPPERIVGPYVEKGATVFDLGCGPGFFTIPMAEMVGESGRVYGVDLQEKMLDKIAAKLFDSDLARRVRVHQCRENTLDLEPEMQADFILAYYMVHETGDQQRFFAECRNALNPGGRMLIVEPPFHVSRKQFEKSVDVARASSFKVLERPRKKGGMAVLLA